MLNVYLLYITRRCGGNEMAIRNNQKMVAFSNKQLVQTLIDEEAAATGLNDSNVIEKNMLAMMLTDNENIRYWLESLYKDETTMNRFMQALFGLIADDWKNTMRTKHNYLLLKIASKMAEGQDPNFKKFDSYSPGYLNSQLDSLAFCCEELVSEAEETDTFLLQVMKSEEISKSLASTKAIQNIKRYNPTPIKEIAERTRIIIKRISEDNNNIILSEIYQILIDAWEYIYEYSFTYKLLLELSKLQKSYDIKLRYELRVSINEASRYWY